MSDRPFFLDTNIIVYSFDRRSPKKRDRAQVLIEEALRTGKGRISYQVVQEFLNVATRKFETPITASDAEIYLQNVLEPLCDIYASPLLFQQALGIAERWHYSYYDSLIIAAASSADCEILYSEDLQHGQSIGKLKIVNPFR